MNVRVSMDGNAVGLTSILHQRHAVFLAGTFTPVVDFLTVLAGTLAFLPADAEVLAEVKAQPAAAAAARAVATARFLRLAAACSSASLRK